MLLLETGFLRTWFLVRESVIIKRRIATNKNIMSVIPLMNIRSYRVYQYRKSCKLIIRIFYNGIFGVLIKN
jgi:hypothetical protein